MKLRSVAAAALAVAAGLTIKRRPGEREVRIGGIEDPEAAKSYLRLNDLPQFRLLRWFIAKRAIQDGFWSRALDVGCGPGRLAILLARRVPHAEVVGIDPSEEMLALAAETARAEGLAERVRFQQGTAEQIPFPDASFDLVLSTLSLHHWTRPVQALAEMQTMLRPGGRLLVFDLRRDMAILPWLLLSFVQRFVVPPPLRHVGEPRGSVLSAYTADEALLLGRQAGLRDPHVTAGPFWLLIESTA